MKRLEMAEATDPLAQYAKEVSKEPVVVTRKGKPIAALISVENADLETVTLSTDPKFMALIEESRADLRARGGISSDEMRRRLGIKPRKHRK